MSPRWKGKGAEAKALANPMSKTVSKLQSSLLQSDARGSLSGITVLLPIEPSQAELLTSACFGRPITNQLFHLSLEEAFYLCHSLKCLKIKKGNTSLFTVEELWQYMKSKVPTFPVFYKAYAHLRSKNWVVWPGSQYGVDFVAYRHHPSLVHSEYTVIVSSEGEINGRLTVWSDLYCTIRLSGSVAKTLLVIHVDKSRHGDASVAALDGYSVQEQTIKRLSPKRNREDDQPVAAPNGADAGLREPTLLAPH
ncbi:tRNA-splicing endonuclease subunit Sen2-2 [Linum grandiflorum]